jgi:nucleotide-binding universal stress UspA family protein
VTRDRAPVVVGVDGSTAARTALRWGADEARSRGVALVAVHVWQPERSGPGIVRAARNEAAVLDRVLAASADDLADVEVVRVVERGDPAAVLLDQAAEGAMLVIGSRRSAATAGGRRSVACRCAEHAVGPVVIVPAEPTAGARFARGARGLRRPLARTAVPAARST